MFPEPDPIEGSDDEKKRFYRIRNAAYSDIEEADRLVRADKSVVHSRNGIGETALHFLVVENDVHSVEWLYEHGADINTRNDFGATPLLEAATLGYVEMCRWLLDHGADLKPRDQYEDSALSAAAKARRYRVVRMLIDKIRDDEDVNTYFDSFSTEEVLQQDGKTAKLLVRRGLRARERE